MPGADRKSFTIRRADQLAALNSPVRYRVAELLSMHGPSSVRELAARMGRAPESLYYHVQALVSVHLVVLKRKRKANRRAEAVYQLVAPRLVIDAEQRSNAYKEAMAGSASALLRLAERDFRSAVERGGSVLAGSRRNLSARRCTTRLTRKGLAQLNHLLDSVLRLLEEHDDREGGQPYALTTVLVPLTDNKEA